MPMKGIKGIVSYDAMETIRNTNEWLGATARALGSYPAFALIPHPAIKVLSAWGRVTERSFSRMVIKPDWEIPPIAGEDGQDHIVYVEPVMRRAFGDLIHFRVARRETSPRKVLLVAPMSGHYATLMRSTVTSLLPDCEVYVTDWHNARDIPVSEGKFDIEDYTSYLVDFIKHLGPDTNVVAVCQPAPLALAATAMLAEEDPGSQPRTLTLIGGPVDPDAAATEVTDFGNRMTMGELEHLAIQSVGFKYRGAGRMVYPGLAQLSSFIAMNAETHARAFIDKIFNEARGTGTEGDRHNKFYDEYLAVMDMTAEFYLSTVERIFKNLEIAQNRFTVNGKPVDIGKISDVAIMTVEGSNDDISAPGQCVAALDLCTGVPAEKKQQHLESGAGHYGIFAGKSWRLNIRPLVLDFIDENMAVPDSIRPKRRRARGGTAADCGASDPVGDSGKIAV
nr:MULTISPECIES: polyhydroxyalkanoate depolymerase [unclassified Paracoccus (in: a-proteobacteria)]